MRIRTHRKLRRQLALQYGRAPDPHYFHGDMEHIRAYYDYRREHGLDSFLLDDVTWCDLDMDRVFKRLNPHRSTSGEQYLYYMLRSPAQEAAAYESRRDLIAAMEDEPELRLDAEVILARLGCRRRADICTAFSPASHGRGMLMVYSLLLLALLGSLAAVPILGGGAIPYALGALLVNSLVHEWAKRRVGRDLDTVNYTVAMIFAVRRLRRLRSPVLDAHLAPAYESLGRLRSVIRTGGVTMADTGTLWDAVATVTLLDLIAYEFLKCELGRHHGDVFAIHEHLGRLDAAIAVASWRRSVPYYAEPELRFGGRGVTAVRARDMVHPLLEDPVPNDWRTDGPMLITGSNASGKSTYLKTAALTAILSQSVCTAPARAYRAAAFRVYSSMAVRDDLLAGESYYVVETRSLKRILDSVDAGGAVLCVIDEVLRGTNTVERIAASCEVLRALADSGALCLAATHDTELCGLLQTRYALYHFEEQLRQSEMSFDYTLRAGGAVSGNAIELLRLMGFDGGIVERARARAAGYLETGVWRTEPG